jgi:hypothetical protein
MKEWNKEELKEMTEEENRIMSITGSRGSGNSSSSESESDSGAASNTIETGDNYVENNNTSLLLVGKPGVNSNSGDDDADDDADDDNDDSNNRHQSTIRSIMREKKILDTYDLAEDVYAFLFVAPVGSGPFCFALYVITVKVIIYGILMGDINFLDVTGGSKSATAAKFFLIPVRTQTFSSSSSSSFFSYLRNNYLLTARTCTYVIHYIILSKII